MPSIESKTTYCLLNCIEKDLRNIFKEFLHGTICPLSPKELKEATKSREPITADWTTVVDALTLSQEIRILVEMRGHLIDKLGLPETQLIWMEDKLQALRHVRNRIAHSNELMVGDYPLVMATAVGLLTSNWIDQFRLFKCEWEKMMANPLYMDSILLPTPFRSEIKHNLPTPDFHETGFIGRDKDKENLLKLLRGNHPLITVTGEGGVGKTSLVLSCLSEVVKPGSGFGDIYDAVIWTSLKIEHLTASGFRTMHDALEKQAFNLKSVTDALSDNLSTSDSAPPAIESEVLETLNLLGANRILLVIDNLETIDWPILRPLFENIPRSSKILITSRLGLGELELLFPVRSMEPIDAVRLMRRAADSFNVSIDYDDQQAEAICERLWRNPLAIRWFVYSKNRGKSDQSLLTAHNDLITVLKFCFDTLYEGLNADQKKCLSLFVASPNPLSEVQVAILLEDYDIAKTGNLLRYLSSCNLLRPSRDDWNNGNANLWALSDICRQYIQMREDFTPQRREKIVNSYHKVMQRRDAMRSDVNAGFVATNFDITSTDEAIVASYLRDAIISMRHAKPSKNQSKFKEAQETLDIARKLSPNYYEVWRVSAHLKRLEQDQLGAREDFLHAFDLLQSEQNNARVKQPFLYHYSKFLMSSRNPEEAVVILQGGADKMDAPLEILDCYSDALRGCHHYRKALEVHSHICQRMIDYPPHLQQTQLVKYAQCLRLAATESKHRDEKQSWIVKALSELARGVTVDEAKKNLIVEAQRCFGHLCLLIAESRALQLWVKAKPDLDELSMHINLIGENRDAVNTLAGVWQEFAEREDYKKITTERITTSVSVVETGVLYGNLKPFDYPRTYGFIVGEDKQEYYYQADDVISDVTWKNFCLNSYNRPRVSFLQADVEKPIEELSQPKATNVQLCSPPTLNLGKREIATNTNRKENDGETRFSGTVKPIESNLPHTLIRGDNGRNYFFHKSELREKTWKDLRLLRDVRVDFAARSDQGRHPRAIDVCIISNSQLKVN